MDLTTVEYRILGLSISLDIRITGKTALKVKTISLPLVVSKNLD